MGKSEFSQLLSAAIVRLLTPHCSAARLGRDRLFQRLESDLSPATMSMEDLTAALSALVVDGMVEEVPTGFQLTKAGLIATRPPGDEMTGRSVQVRRDQKRMGGMKYPGRQGVVIYENSCGRNSPGGLWYVRLDATNRAGERVETFWGTELDAI